MQWILFVLSSAVLATAGTIKGKVEDFRIEPLNSKDNYEVEVRDLLPRDVIYHEHVNSIKPRSDSSEIKLPRKRALSVLSRWKPLGNWGVQTKSSNRSSSRKTPETGDGGRPLGMPLRWGRKR